MRNTGSHLFDQSITAGVSLSVRTAAYPVFAHSPSHTYRKEHIMRNTGTKKKKAKEKTKGEELTKDATRHFAHPDKLHVAVMQRIYDIFIDATSREKLLLWMFWELQSASGYTKLDVANELMRDLDDSLDVGDDPELLWMKGFCEGVELLNVHG